MLSCGRVPRPSAYELSTERGALGVGLGVGIKTLSVMDVSLTPDRSPSSHLLVQSFSLIVSGEIRSLTAILHLWFVRDGLLHWENGINKNIDSLLYFNERISIVEACTVIFTSAERLTGSSYPIPAKSV